VKRILAGIDPSADSRTAAEIAAVLARATAASLELVFVNELGPVCVPLQHSDTGPRQREQRERGEQLLRQVAASLDPKPALRVEQGSPAEVLCKLARDPEVTLVVAGSRGHHSILRGLLGSCSERLLLACSKPVVIVHSPRADPSLDTRGHHEGR
jgi:nucleotide-binding universal stress UspA family protein